MTRAVFAFSADPVTNGHIDIVNRASRLFDEIVIATVRTTGKAGEMFTGDQRLEMCRCAFKGNPVVVDYKFIDGTTVDLCKSVRARFLIRGIRGYTDLDYELNLSHINREISNGTIDTIFIPSKLELSMFSSSAVRGLIKVSVDNWKKMVPESVAVYIEELRKHEKVFQ